MRCCQTNIHKCMCSHLPLLLLPLPPPTSPFGICPPTCIVATPQKHFALTILGTSTHPSKGLSVKKKVFFTHGYMPTSTFILLPSLSLHQQKWHVTPLMTDIPFHLSCGFHFLSYCPIVVLSWQALACSRGIAKWTNTHTHHMPIFFILLSLSLPHFTSYMLPIYEVANPRTCIGLPLHPAGYLTHPERRVHGQNNCPGGNMSHANLHLHPLPLLPPTPTKECHIWPSSHFGTLTITLRNQREPMPFWPWLLGWTPP